MALKFKYGSREQIPADQAGLYVERDGAWLLDVEGAVDKAKLEEFRATNVTLMKERDELKQRFEGKRVSESQALQWPRYDCPDPDGAGELASDKVPAAVVKATCELAKELLLADRTAAPPGQGILEQHNADYSATVYSKKDTRQIIPDLVQAMLARLGDLIRKGTVARLQRA